MRATNLTTVILKTRVFAASTALLLLAGAARAAVPGITGSTSNGSGPTFNLTAQPAFLNQPDGAGVYSWGYGCNGTPAGFAPAGMVNPSCSTMQVPGPTLIVTEGQAVTVNLTNNLPAAAGNTSILFPGFTVTPTGGVPGLLTQEAAPGGTVTYTFTASAPGTRPYYSGTQGDLQVEMGLYGAIIVLPASVPPVCTTPPIRTNLFGVASYTGTQEQDFRLSQSAYDHPGTCYDREYLFQFSEMDPNIHQKALAQVAAAGSCTAGSPGCSLNVPTEPYRPGYFLINGRSMPDDMDANYESEYPHQPYNGNPHMHPGENTLIRVIGQGRWQHPFHEHGNHVRILARDGNLILGNGNVQYGAVGAVSGVGGVGGQSAQALAGLLMFTTDTTPGQAFDGIFYWTGRGLNWDAFGHHTPAAKNTGCDTSTNGVCNPNSPVYTTGIEELPCTPDANGYNTVSSGTYNVQTALNYYEWCQDHNKPLEVSPFGDVGSGGPATLPNPNIFTNGAWYSGSPYLGPDATTRATGTTSDFQPSNTQANPGNERGYAFMWHSHNEREITTNNVFPGGMLMMMLVDSREFVIDESK